MHLHECTGNHCQSAVQCRSNKLLSSRDPNANLAPQLKQYNICRDFPAHYALTNEQTQLFLHDDPKEGSFFQLFFY